MEAFTLLCLLNFIILPVIEAAHHVNGCVWLARYDFLLVLYSDVKWTVVEYGSRLTDMRCRMWRRCLSYARLPDWRSTQRRRRQGSYAMWHATAKLPLVDGWCYIGDPTRPADVSSLLSEIRNTFVIISVTWEGVASARRLCGVSRDLNWANSVDHRHKYSI